MKAAAPTAPCVDATELVAFYASAGSHPRAELVRDHLASCRACLELARDARLFLRAVGRPAAAPAESPRPAARRGSPWPRTLSWAAAAALVPCALLVAQRGWIWPAPGAPSGAKASANPTPATADEWWRRVPVPKAAYEPASGDAVTWRDAGEAPRPGAFERAMEPYARDAFAEVEPRLAEYLQGHPHEARALFYRGVTLLLLDRADEAARCLREAGAARSSFAGEARWYLALALLRSGDTLAAAAPLAAAARGTGPRADEARSLLERLRTAPRR